MVLRELSLSLPGKDVNIPVRLAPGLRLEVGRLLDPLALPRRLFVVSDRRVARLYADQVTRSLAAAGYRPSLLTVSPGERSKTWPVVERLARRLLELGADRQTALIALGGGVVGDLTGFLASIFMRGVPFIQVPTTLLAMVDAAIGGKTGINLKEGKNLLGTFYQPRLVAIDPEFLGTLPRQERLNGLAEVLKSAFIRDPELLTRLEQTRSSLFQDQAELTEIIHRSATIKVKVVAADEREAGLRRILNFGHTLGHALEAASNFRMPHGQAVSYGMLAALELSRRLTGLSPEAAAYGRRLIRDLGLARTPPKVDADAVMAALPLDKKRQDQALVFVLLKEFGHPVIHPDTPLPLIRQAMRVWEE